ncbi:hypothetical protein HYN48_15100 [Flavobacterium magnum]|uniref:LamG-like jellyroll fold domain-containing protein n=1 Tax=Flavobacterium magnum TaxID=2162713 RepID=A0A2S0RKR5_9FLAO|nr:choice-of-anchor D domain-containing protein [Flavobacterium magnum]AWA31312.1 hypothetical protein HYN48_15100 [Flavobacterium magnum]
MENTTMTFKKLLFLFSLLLSAAYSAAQDNTATFNSDGTFTVPAGYTYNATIHVWGAGGRGGSRSGSNGAGGGGGGGAYSSSTIVLTAGTYNVTVGTGATTDIADGEDSSFSTLVIAKGGKTVGLNSATGGAGGQASAGTGTIKYSGGAGVSATSGVAFSGGGGASAGTANDGATGLTSTGGIALNGGGNGGAGRLVAVGSGNGTAGTTPGGGGGGALRNSAVTVSGGAGANGRVIVTWNNPEINIRGNGNNIATGDNSPSTSDNTDFGTVDYYSGTISKTFTIQNSGVGLLGIGNITFSGSGAADFSVTTQPTLPVAASGGSTTFTVTFDPSAVGTRTAIISIPNNDADENPYTFTITGNGGTPNMTISGNNTVISDNDNSPSTSDFTNLGAQYIFSGLLTRTYTIKNTGTATVVLGAVTIGGTNAVEFSASTPAATVAPGAEVTFTISFNPSGAGSRVGSFSIVTNVSGANPYNFSIAGTGNTYLDSDGDGITDNNDLDDDNDGVPDTLEESICKSVSSLTASTIFLNEDFGTGTTRVQISETTPSASTNYTFESGQTLYDDDYTVYYKIAGINQADPTNISDFSWYAWVKSDDHTPGDTNGRMAVFNASNNAGVFYENTINGILPNIDVSYSFWVMNLDNLDSAFSPSELPRKTPTIKVEFIDTSTNAVISGTTYTTPSITRCASGNSCTTSIWKNFTTTANLGSRTSFKIRLSNTSPGGFGNDLAMDDIVISQKYCDLEGDGDADIFDLDDDNDGIPDVVEAGFGAYSSGKSTMDLSNGTKWVDANTNGLNDLVVGQTPLDSDGDLIYDFMDLDSDNDGIFDIDEAQKDTFYTGGANAKYNGDADINGDGVDDSGADTDGDGIQDLNDEDPNVFGTGVVDATKRKAFPTDTNNDGKADYRDVKSNGSTFDIAGTLFASFDGNNDGKVDGTTDVDKDGIRDAIDNNTSTVNAAGYGSPRSFTDKKLLIDFDGRNDYGEGPALISNLSSATIMGWIKLDEFFASAGVLFGNSNLYLSVGSDRKLSAATPNVSTTFSSTALDLKRWYHVAASYSSSGSLLLYLNGKLVSSVAASGSLPTTTSKFTIAKTSGALTNFFKGYIDEIRVFNTQLTADQIQKMVYQEIQLGETNKVKGTVITTKEIESTTWASLIGYFRMDNYKNDVIDDYTIAGIDDDKSNTAFTRIYNVKYLKTQNAPLPFKTKQAGILDSTALTDTENFIYGPDVAANDYSIIKVQHDVTLANNLTGVGLIVDAGKKITVNSDKKIENTWYLDLQGTIDLTGKSQLIQGASSDLATTTTGKIERDQQGTKNPFNYNYWSSPVIPSTNGAGVSTYTVDGVMKDGTSGSPVNLQWINDQDAPGTTPVTLSRAWIYKYQNLTNAYASWSYVGETGALSAGQGFTLKGSNAAASNQNYVFVGKPNNGDITSPIAASNLSLVGNPYPSALDSEAFIKDNIIGGNPGTSGALDSALYIWIHAPENNTHVYANYKGGYATLNLVGGLPPQVKASGTGGTGTSTSYTPGRYIPVGQGFFVQGSTTGGSLKFKNSQRAFIKENESTSNALFRTAQTTTDEDTPTPATSAGKPKIRIGFDNNAEMHRQLLIGFMGSDATDGFDIGYDALSFDANPSDMYFKTNDGNLLIQGVGYFQDAAIYPLGVTSDTAAPVKFSLDGVEELDDNQPIYIYDSLDDSYHNLREGNFETVLDAGTFEQRFSLRFSNPLGVTNPVNENQIGVIFTNNDQTLNIKNTLNSTTVESAVLFNVLGQQISAWDVKNENQENIRIPVKNISAGTYIVKVKTTTGSVSKKIIVR